MPDAATGQRAPWGLRIVLVLLAAGNLFGLWFGLTHRDEVFQLFPRLNSAIWPIYLAIPIVGLAGVAGMFLWRRWAFWLLMGLGGVTLAIELYAMGWGIHVSRIFVVTALLIVCVRPVWGRFR